MDDKKLTREQRAATKVKGNVIVSAAAGSGKTAVLVERIIKLICDNEHPVSADRLLIVTFTRAAAAEMRSRIEKSLEDECAKSPDNAYLIKQKLLLQSADICTIDSYCINFLKNNFELCGVSPDFSVAEDVALEKIKLKAFETVIGKYYEEKDRVFVNLLNTFSAEYNHKNLMQAVFALYDKSSNYPFPSLFLDEVADNYSKEGRHVFFDKAFEIVVNRLNYYKTITDGIAELCNSNEILKEKRIPTLLELKSVIEKLLELAVSKDYSVFKEYLSGVSFEKSPQIRDKSVEKEKSVIDPLIKAARDSIKSLRDETFFLSIEELEEEFSVTEPITKMLIEIVKDFSAELRNRLNEKNLLTFNIIEHIAFETLCEYVDGEIRIKDSARRFIDAYDEVLVDEYQDVNDLQDIFFAVISDNSKKLFTVGDMKQSIYGFRGSNPENFNKKTDIAVDYEAAAEDDAKKILLGANFRSKASVCDYVNFFFENAVGTCIDGFKYSDDEKLVPRADYPESKLPGVEIDFIDCEPSGEDGVVLEAQRIADYINEIMSSGEVIRDSEDKTKLRKAKYSDFTILLRGIKDKGKALINNLKFFGIPVTTTNDSFWQSKEVVTVKSLLETLDNPTNDISLLSLMMSPLYGFNADNLAAIRTEKKKGSLLSSVIKSSEHNKKCADFLKSIEYLRRLSVIIGLSKFLIKLYEITDIVNIFKVYGDTEKRRANLHTVISLASDYESNEGGSLHGFLRHLDWLIDNEINVGDNVTESNCVTVSTMHGSKGLQYPVCILAGGSSDLGGYRGEQLKTDDKLGIGYKYFNEKDGLIHESFAKKIISECNSENISEELRILYVAMTRAEDQLLIISSHNKLKKEAANAAIMQNIFKKPNADYVKSLKKYDSFILSTSLLHKDAAVLRAYCGVNVPTSESNSSVVFRIFKDFEDKIIETDEPKYEPNLIFAEKTAQNIAYEYPYAALENVTPKSSVSALVHGSTDNNEYDFISVPSFISESGFSPAQRGTVTHRVMQFINFEKASESFDGELERLTEYGFITEAEAGAVDRDAVSAFLRDGIAKRILASSDVRREMRFLTEIPASDVSDALPEICKNEQVVIQGAVDCVFDEGDGIVVLDFKTDRVKDGGVLKERYQKQLDIYADACKKIFSKPVKEKIIYSFTLSKCIYLDK